VPLLHRAACAVAGALASPAAAFAQATQPGSIQGRVLDTTGLPLPAVLVEVESTGTPLLARTGYGQLLVAAEAMGNDGPWERPDEMRRWNGLVRYSQGGAASGQSRVVQGEPLAGVDGIHLHPVEPFTFRVALLASF
jgi:ABC-type sugar transport system substrate-binding protein